jgi:hypothetical protein
MGKGRGVYWVLVGKPEWRRSFGRPSMNGIIILKWIFERRNGKWFGLFWLRIATGGGLL